MYIYMYLWEINLIWFEFALSWRLIMAKYIERSHDNLIRDRRYPTRLNIFWPPVFPDHTVYPKKYAHGFCFAVLCCGYTLTDFPISIRLTSLALWQSNDGPSASKATLMNMDKYFMWINNERLHNHNKAKHNKTVCIFLGIYCIYRRHQTIIWTNADLSSMWYGDKHLRAVS